MAETMRFREDEPHDEPAVSLDAFLEQSNATAVRLEAGEDARALIPYLDRLALIDVDFPVFGDGRGYSAAQILREHGYRGELRASGDVLVDQMPFLRRCGFDAFAPDKPIDPAVLERALARYPFVYQNTVDKSTAIWEHRHG